MVLPALSVFFEFFKKPEENSSTFIATMPATNKEKRVRARERRKKIFRMLCNGEKLTRTQLSEMFGVTTRTIDNDIVFLSIDYPLCTQVGRGGGIYVHPDCTLYSCFLTRTEKELLERLKETLQEKDKETIQAIIDKFGMPEIRR